MKIEDILTPQRIELAMHASSKKRVLEHLSELLASDTGVDPNAVFQALIERERIGSTGIGEGVAIPHGRMKELKNAIGAFAILDRQVDFDSIDQKPVNIVFALIVPTQATDEHLQLLAQLAKIFSNARAKERLLEASSPDNVCSLFQELNSNQAVA